MNSTRINARVISPAPPTKGDAHGSIRIALSKLTAAEAACCDVDEGTSGQLNMCASQDELDAIADKAESRGLAEFARAVRGALKGFCRTHYDVPLPGGGKLSTGERTLLMGVVNVTPDSFSDGGRFLEADQAIAHGLALVEQGADILDIGGESTRPGAEAVSPEEELDRVIPVVTRLAAKTDVPISIDTSKAAVAEKAIDSGARIVNDVTAMQADAEMAQVVARTGAAVVLMHMQGVPRTMQQHPEYDDVIGDICRELRKRIQGAQDAGIDSESIIIDPGIGFGKTVRHNLEILDRLGELRSLGRPVLIGTSRKSTIGAVLDAPVEQRLFGTAATVALAVRNGAGIVRVHDVAQMADVVRIADAVRLRRPAPVEELR